MKFVYDRKKELEIFQTIKETKFQEPSRSMVEEELDKVSIPADSPFLKSLVEYIENNWLEVEENFLTQLGKFYGRDLEKPKLTCYLVRFNVYPYNFKDKEDSWFCAPLFISPAERNRVIMHELCHYFQPVELPRDIKEAIPVILNDHEVFKMYSFDRGHNSEEEQRWRKKILELYKAGKGFADLLSEIEKEQNR